MGGMRNERGLAASGENRVLCGVAQPRHGAEVSAIRRDGRQHGRFVRPRPWHPRAVVQHRAQSGKRHRYNGAPTGASHPERAQVKRPQTGTRPENAFRKEKQRGVVSRLLYETPLVLDTAAIFASLDETGPDRAQKVAGRPLAAEVTFGDEPDGLLQYGKQD
jgi:hypothetical protein